MNKALACAAGLAAAFLAVAWLALPRILPSESPAEAARTPVTAGAPRPTPVVPPVQAALRALPPAREAALRQAFGGGPLRFEANRGQAGREVKFFARGPGYSVLLKQDEAVLALQKGQRPHEESPARPGPSVSRDVAHLFRGGGVRAQRKGPASEDAGYSVLRMKLVGANPTPRLVGEEPLPGRVNYYIGNDPRKWRTGVVSYAQVRYLGMYPGIDLIYHGKNGQLEYDFVVGSGADPQKIRLRFEGAEKVAVTAQSDLVLHIAGREVIQQAPRIYQEVAGRRQEIPGGYVLPEPASTFNFPLSTVASQPTSHEVGFHVGAYDRRLPLIIDPVLVYSTYLGGRLQDDGYKIAVDAEGNIYVHGSITRSMDFPTENPFQPEHGGGENFIDNFVTKFNPSGSALIYSTYLGGSGDDWGTGIAVDAEGNAYVTGWTNSPNFPVVKAFQPTLRGTDAFVTKFDPTGAVVYSTYLGGSLGEDSRGIAVDAEGNAYVTGGTNSPDFPTAKPFQANLRGVADVFLAKFDPTGSALVFSTYLGGDSGEGGWGIAVDRNSNVYVTGRTQSLNFPTVKPFQPTYGGGFLDAFVTKFEASGSALVYSTYLGGSDDDVGLGVAVDAEGNCHVTGQAASRNFPTVNGFQPDYGGGGDAFVTKFNASGSVVYSTYLGGSNWEYGRDIAVDTEGHAYVVGETTSPDFPIQDAFQPDFFGYDAFVTKLEPNGSALVYSSYLGGSVTEIGLGIAVDAQGNAYVTGQTASPDFPTVEPFQPEIAGDVFPVDAFVSKISPNSKR